MKSWYIQKTENISSTAENTSINIAHTHTQDYMIIKYGYNELFLETKQAKEFVLSYRTHNTVTSLFIAVAKREKKREVTSNRAIQLCIVWDIW